MGTWPSAAQTSGSGKDMLVNGINLRERKREDLLTFPVRALGAQDFEDIDAAAAV